MSTDKTLPNVEPSSVAFKMAQKWLAKKGMNPKLDDGSGAVGKPRPAGLGLGAKFLPHHKGTITAMGLETQLRKRLARSQSDTVQRSQEAGSAEPWSQQGGADGADDSEEEDGRAAAFAARPKPAPKADSAAPADKRMHAPFKRPKTKRKQGKSRPAQPE